MSRVTNIINDVRLELGDTSSQRYTDDILIRQLNIATENFIFATKCLKERIYMGLGTASAIYDMRNYVLEFERVEYNNNKIEALSFTELDNISSEWQTEIGEEVKYVTFDHLPRGMIRVYPRVSGAFNNIEQNSLYGGLIDITINDDTYQIPSIEDVEENLEKYLVLYVLKKPKLITISTLDSELELHSSYDQALIHFIKAKLLRNDTDAINRQYGNEELQLYNNFCYRVIVDNSKSNNVAQTRVVKYNGGFE